MKSVIAWFSAGSTSAVACKIATQMYDNVRVIYIDTHSVHPDNDRFLSDCERWYGQPIERRQSSKYMNVIDVITHRRYINGPHGAPCTQHLKKEVRYEIQDEIGEWDGQVFGFEYSLREVNRAIRFRQQYPSTKPIFPLIDRQITKSDALGIIQRAGIEIPVMYRLGYHNNNCIGCVKGGIAYWNKIRRDFPDTFNRMAAVERVVGATCLKDEHGRVFLDELDPSRGDRVKAITPECSIFCEIELSNIIDPQTYDVMRQQLNINNTH